MTAEELLHYAVAPNESSLTIEARSTLHVVHAKTSDVSGFVDLSWNGDGTLATSPKPRVHVEFPIGRLRSGNVLQDRQVSQLVDAGRFPKVAADLVDLAPSTVPGRYNATGEVTLAGRVRTYKGEFSIVRQDEAIALDGALNIDIRDFGLRPPELADREGRAGRQRTFATGCEEGCVTVIEERPIARHHVEGMRGEPTSNRFEAQSADSSLTFYATSSLFPVYGKSTEITGYVEAAWRRTAASRRRRLRECISS